MADIKKTLPKSVGDSRGIGAIQESCDAELDRLEEEARAACFRLAAATADAKGCAMWERELGLDIREDLPLGARRVLIQVALEQMDTWFSVHCRPSPTQPMSTEMASVTPAGREPEQPWPTSS